MLKMTSILDEGYTSEDEETFSDEEDSFSSSEEEDTGLKIRKRRLSGETFLPMKGKAKVDSEKQFQNRFFNPKRVRAYVHISRLKSQYKNRCSVNNMLSKAYVECQLFC